MKASDTISGLGALADYIAQVPSTDPVGLGLSPDETALFAVVGRVSRIAEVLAKSSHDEARTIASYLVAQFGSD